MSVRETLNGLACGRIDEYYGKGVAYADGVIVNIDELTELPEILVYVGGPRQSFTMVNAYVNDTAILYGIHCSNYRSHFDRESLDLLVTLYPECNNRSIISMYFVIGDHMRKYGEDYPSDLGAIYRLVRMANMVITSIMNEDILLSRIGSPYQPNPITGPAKIMYPKEILKKYISEYYLDLGEGITYADGVEVDIGTLTELPEILVHVNKEFESFTLVNTCIDGMDKIYGIYCLNICSPSEINLIYTMSHKDEYSKSSIMLHPIIGHHICDTYGEEYLSNLDVIYRLINMANPIVALLLDKDRLASCIDCSSLVKRAS